MDKAKAKKILRNRFNEITEDSKIIYYRNIKDFNYLTLEKFNPNHIFYIYGRPNKRNRKNKYKNIGYVRFAKVIL